MTIAAAMQCADGVLLGADGDIQTRGTWRPTWSPPKLAILGPRHALVITGTVGVKRDGEPPRVLLDLAADAVADLPESATVDEVTSAIAARVCEALTGSDESRVLVVTREADGTIAKRTCLVSADGVTPPETLGILAIVSAPTVSAAAAKHLVQTRHFAPNRTTTTEALSLLAECFRIASAQGERVAWPLECAIVRTAGIQRVRLTENQRTRSGERRGVDAAATSATAAAGER